LARCGDEGNSTFFEHHGWIRLIRLLTSLLIYPTHANAVVPLHESVPAKGHITLLFSAMRIMRRTSRLAGARDSRLHQRDHQEIWPPYRADHHPTQ
jgi:hypothetical protein